MASRKNGPVILTILDGWGHRVETHGNAIALARKPNYDKLLREYPHSLIRASEHFVGLPDGQMGNSEVGHLNLGAGRVVRMDISRIDEAIASGAFFEDETLVKAMQHASVEGRALHLIGLVSDGGVHSQQRHLWALLRMAAAHKLERVYVMRSWTVAIRCLLRVLAICKSWSKSSASMGWASWRV